METYRELEGREKVGVYLIIKDYLLLPVKEGKNVVVKNCLVESKILIKTFNNWKLYIDIESRKYLDKEMDVMFRNGFRPLSVKEHNGAHINHYEVTQNDLEKGNLNYEIHIIKTGRHDKVLLDKKVSFTDIDYVFG